MELLTDVPRTVEEIEAWIQRGEKTWKKQWSLWLFMIRHLPFIIVIKIIIIHCKPHPQHVLLYSYKLAVLFPSHFALVVLSWGAKVVFRLLTEFLLSKFEDGSGAGTYILSSSQSWYWNYSSGEQHQIYKHVSNIILFSRLQLNFRECIKTLSL